MRCPVIIGSSAPSRSRTGRGRRTGQSCCIVSSCRARRRPAAPAARRRPRYSPGGARDHAPAGPGRHAAAPVAAAPRSGRRRAPARARRPRARRTRRGGVAGVRAAAPGCTWKSAAPVSGRSRPSKMPPSRPGPSVTDSGRPRPVHRIARLESGRVLVDLRDESRRRAAGSPRRAGALADRERLEDAETARDARAQHRPADPGDAGFAHGACSRRVRPPAAANSASSSATMRSRAAEQARDRGVEAGVARARAAARRRVPRSATSVDGGARLARCSSAAAATSPGAASSTSTCDASRCAGARVRRSHAATTPSFRAAPRPASATPSAAGSAARRARAARRSVACAAAPCVACRGRRAGAQAPTRPRAASRRSPGARACAPRRGRARRISRRLRRRPRRASGASRVVLLAREPPQQRGGLGFEQAVGRAHASIPSALRTCAGDVRRPRRSRGRRG